MSIHRVKGISYDYDEHHDYADDYDDEELTPEDKEQLKAGTVAVREELGADFPASEKEIQDALWHYYYDVGKSVAYLKNRKRLASQPKQTKQKQASRFDNAASAAASKAQTGNLIDPSCHQIYATFMQPLSASDYFRGISWRLDEIPTSRLSNMVLEPEHPRGRLLGGASKPSKLAALAAARKKKGEEKRTETPTPESAQSDRVVALLDRLNLKKDKEPPLAPAEPAERSVKRTKFMSSRQKEQNQQAADAPTGIDPMEKAPPTAEERPIPVANIRALPSMFAKAICKQPTASATLMTEASCSNRTQQWSGTFSLPYIHNPSFIEMNPFAGPSPDDVVLQAQSKGAKSNGKGKPSTPTPNGLAQDVSNLGLQDVPKVKSKNLNVVEEFGKAKMKDAVSFVVVGHVDHGKSTLMGRLLYDLRVVDEKTVDKLRRDSKKIGKGSFALAWVMDATSDERERGVTVDIATKYFETEKTRFTILDAPGHQDFIPNMISGASQADLAVLVIDASTNSFEAGLRGQTKEHAMLVRSMGVQRLIVAVNKMDACEWSQDRFKEIQQQMTAFLASANFSSKSVSFVPCAGLTGDNVVVPVDSAKAPWYKGSTLIQELDHAEPTKRLLEKPLRMTISEVFSSSPNNPISVSGKVDAGSLQVGDKVKILPSGETAVIKSLDADGQPADWAVAGQIVVLNLALGELHLKHGDIICHEKDALKNVKEFTAKILSFEHIMPMYVDVHRGPMHAPGKIIRLVATLNKADGEVAKKRPKVIQPGVAARVVIELDEEMPLEAPNKIVLRADGRSVAAGLIE